MEVLRQSGPTCRIHNDRNSFELHILQGVQSTVELVGIPTFPTFSPNSYFFSNFLLLFLLFDQIPSFTTFYNENNIIAFYFLNSIPNSVLLFLQIPTSPTFYLSYLLDNVEYWVVQQHKSWPKILSEMNI